MMKIILLTKYGNLGASSRMRTFQYIYLLENEQINIVKAPFLNNHALAARYSRGSYSLIDLIESYVLRIKALLSRRQFDVLWIEKEALPWLPLWVEAGLLNDVPYVLDYDDAVFHNYDQHRFSAVRWLYGKRLDGLMAKAALVVAGNEYLAQRAQLAGAPFVEVVPTVIDLNRYPLPLAFGGNGSADPFCVVWIGSPSTAQYLKLIEKALQAFAKKWPLLLRVIGADFKIAGVQTECVQWTEATEVESIAAGHVGVMPLQDSPWERGKCGYKLIQYMACGLPVVASPVGVNNQIVEHGVNGFLVRSDAEWVMALEQLFTQAHLRQRMGKAGRAKVEAQYCIQKTGPKMAELLKKAAKGG
jgi:glycosyltransferase involved in cell wall biosynthesis